MQRDPLLMSALLHELPAALVVTGLDGLITFASERASAISARALPGTDFGELLAVASRAAYADRRRALSHQAAPVEMDASLLGRDGNEVPISLRMRLIEAADERCIAHVITEVVRSKSDARSELASIIDVADDAIYIIGKGGTIESWNAGATRLFGYSADEVVGRSVEILLPPGNQDFPSFRDRLVRGDTVRRYEAVRRRKDGSIVDVSLTVTPLRNGHTPAGYAAIARDITESKASQYRLAVTDRLAALGTLAASVGHEINNPLAVIIANLSVAADELGGDDKRQLDERELRTAMLDALEAADRIRVIVSDLRGFLRYDPAAKQLVALHEACETAIRMSENAFRHRARVTRRYEAAPAVEANQSRLVQVFTNLLVNAYQAIEDGDDRSDHEITVTTRTDAAGRAVAEVRDDGPGMAPDILRRVFDPFFTTKGVRQGTGLGLTVSHNIIASLDGVIEVESQPGHGAVFRVVLPPAKTTSQPVSPPAAPRATTHRGHILVIDDDAAVARAIHGILQSEHDVSSLVSARAAVEHLEAGHEYDLVLCDLMMPEVTGMALYARLKAHSPAQASKLVFITGGAFTSEAERFLEESGCTYLSKAITPHELRAFARDFIMGTPTAPSP